MTIIVTGRNGFVASHLVSFLSQYRDDVMTTSSVGGPGTVRLDLRQAGSFPYERLRKNDLVVLSAAVSSPDRCAKEYNLSYDVNVRGTEQFVSKCLERGVKVLFLSSDTVYGETERPVNELSPCYPIGDYADMKYEVENKFNGESNFKTFRLSYVFSRSDKFTSYLKRCSLQGDVAEIFEPLYRNVVHLQDVLLAIRQVYTHWEGGERVVNIAGPELISRRDITEVYKTFVDESLNYRTIQPDTNFFRTRPKVINMKSLYLEELLGRSPMSIEKAMQIEFGVQE